MSSTSLQRALRSAPERAAAAQARPEQEFFTFRVGDLRLAVASEHVIEVLRAGLLTPLPRTPAFILGVSGHRGEVIPVMDVLRFLGKGEARLTVRTRMFVGVSQSFVSGVVADAVLGLQRIPLVDILPPPLGGDSSAEHLSGVVQGGASGSALSILNFPKVLQTARQRVVSR